MNALIALALAADPVLPQVIEAPAPVWPDDADDSQPVGVTLRVTLTPQGDVIDVQVVESVSPGFDAAAVDAAWATLFSPAYDADGNPAPAVVTYTVTFQPGVESPANADSVIVVESDRVTAEVTERTVSGEEIRYLPGTSNDAVKVVQNLPGVARPPLGTGNLIIRGTAPEDSLTTLDGSPIPLVFHFGGLTSVVPSDLLSEVAYVPGNASVRYGRTLGGVVDLRTTTSLPGQSSAYVSVDLYQSAFFVERRLGEDTSLTVAGRRSYIDAVLTPILSSGTLRVQAPRYYDGQVRLVHETDTATWDVLLYGSDDRFRFLGVDDDTEEEAVFASYADRFARLRIRRLDTRGPWDRETMLAVGPESRFFEFSTASEAIETDWSANFRQELSGGVTDSLSLRTGLDVQAGRQTYLFYLANVSGRDEGESPYFAPAAYGELTWQQGPATLIGGLRGDVMSYGGPGSAGSVVLQTLDPRMTARYAVADFTTLKASVGRYSAFPELRAVDAGGDGNPKLGPERSLQATVGFEQQVLGNLRVDGSLFANRLTEQVVGREDRLRFFTGPPPIGPFDTDSYANDGVGRVIGAEVLARYDGPTSTAMLSVTVSNSQRQDRPDDEVELFEYDQPLVLTALWSQQLPRNWRAGVRLRYGSGNPYTPVVNSYLDLDSRQWRPVYGDRSSARLDPFFSTDVRIDKTWELRRFDLVGYLEVQNATFAQSPEYMAWNYDYSEEEPFVSNPPLPVFGLRGEF